MNDVLLQLTDRKLALAKFEALMEEKVTKTEVKTVDSYLNLVI